MYVSLSGISLAHSLRGSLIIFLSERLSAALKRMAELERQISDEKESIFSNMSNRRRVGAPVWRPARLKCVFVTYGSYATQRARPFLACTVSTTRRLRVATSHLEPVSGFAACLALFG